MKKICDFVKNFVIIAYILLIIFVTICLLSYNDYQLTVLDGNTLIPVIDEELEPKCTIGDLLIVNKNKLSSVKAGDEVFFYRASGGQTIINFGKIIATERVTDTEYTFTVEGDYKFSSSNFIGKVETTKVIPKVGKILSILQSKWGFLFLGVFPSLIAFLYTLYTVVLELQVPEKEKSKTKNKKAKSKKSNNASNIEEKKPNEIKKENQVSEKPNKENDSKENIKNEINEEAKKESVKEENKKEEQKVEEKNKEIEKNVEQKANLKSNLDENPNEIKNAEETKEEKVVVKNEKKVVEPQKIQEKKQEETKMKNETKVQQSINANQKNVQTEEQRKKAIIEAKMKSMTEEEKKALIQAKLNSMTEEEKRALIEAKKKKMEAEKNKK